MCVARVDVVLSARGPCHTMAAMGDDKVEVAGVVNPLHGHVAPSKGLSDMGESARFDVVQVRAC